MDNSVRSHAPAAEVLPCDVPLGSFLRKYQDGQGFADCYVIEVPGTIRQAAFVEAFYTSALFKIERNLLRYFLSRPATDADAWRLAAGTAAEFSAWNVESQSPSELLLADIAGRTRSWLMAIPVALDQGTTATRLYFGSAVLARARPGSQQPSVSWQFRALLGFHRLYSRWLLRAAIHNARARTRS